MRTAITVIRRHGSEEFELVAGPEVSLTDHTTNLRKALTETTEPSQIAEYQMWVSDSGLHRTVNFMSPEAHEAHEEQQAKDAAAHSAQLKKDSEAHAEPEAHKEQQAKDSAAPEPESQPEKDAEANAKTE